MIRFLIAIWAAKSVRWVGRAFGRHGSALPGLVAERICPDFLNIAADQLTEGVCVVTGTNGKTTTTQLIVQLLGAEGRPVVTNASGSNLSRGIVGALIEQMSVGGTLQLNSAAFELDEAYAPQVAKALKPDLLVALNVLRDQLDRYGEIDTTAQLIAQAAHSAKHVVVNGNDELLLKRVSEVKKPSQITTVGLTTSLQKQLTTEATFAEKQSPENDSRVQIISVKKHNDVQTTTFIFDEHKYSFQLPLQGVHNAFNAVVAAIAVRRLSPLDLTRLDDYFSITQPAFGRGETVEVDGRPVTVALVKNPAGLTQNLATFVRPEIGAICIVINDDYADGRDVSWLWDAQVKPLLSTEAPIYVAGTRKHDMALRLKYEGIKSTTLDDATVELAIKSLLLDKKLQGEVLIVPTYTAMLAVRKWLAKKLGAKTIW